MGDDMENNTEIKVVEKEGKENMEIIQIEEKYIIPNTRKISVRHRKLSKNCTDEERAVNRNRHNYRYNTDSEYRKQCLESSRNYKAKHKKELKEYNKLYMKDYRKKLRELVFTYYGGTPPRCKCCNEIEHDFLSLDHINGGGCAERRKKFGSVEGTSDKLYLHLIKNNYPGGFQILCMNCNWGKRRTGVCPHILKVEVLCK